MSRTNSYFALQPSINVPRTKFSPPIFSYKTTFDNGSLIPIFCEEAYAADTFKISLASLVRMTTPVKPIMDNLFLDVFFFYIPYRLVWSHWEEFMGANKTTKWVPSVEYTIPQLIAPCVTGVQSVSGTRLTAGSSISLIDSSNPVVYWTKLLNNDDLIGSSPTPSQGSTLFKSLRDRRMLVVASSATSTTGTICSPAGSTSSFDSSKTYYRLFIGWRQATLADYFGIPIGTFASVSQLPFRAYGLVWNEFFRSEPYMDPVDIQFDSDSTIFGSNVDESVYNTDSYVTEFLRGGRPLRVSRFHDYFSSGLPQPTFGDPVKIPFSGLAPLDLNLDSTSGVPFQTVKLYGLGQNSISGTHALGTNASKLSYDTGSATPTGSFQDIWLRAGTDVSSVAGTIQDLRTAFQINKYMERSARSGSRYIEIIQAQFGVRNPDYRLQRPEYLGGFRKPLNITQVLQTSSTNDVTPQGNTSAYSLTTDMRHVFTKSFTEPGLVLGLCATRTSRSYQQGLHKRWTRRRKLDYYFPVFARLSEQPILNREIYLSDNYIGRTADFTWTDVSFYENQVLSYQEAWSEMRYHESYVTSDFRSDADETLDFWHFADYYESEVYMSREWMLEGPQNVDRTLAVTSRVSRQFLADFSFKVEYTRPMPLNSVPGLADHF